MRSYLAVGFLFFSAAVSAQSLPVGALALDGPATPEQLSLTLPVTGALPADATATVRYKQSSSTTWTTGHPLHRVRTAFTEGGGPTVEDVFAWPIIDLTSGTSYDIEVTVTSGAASLVKTLTATTRTLPAASGATTISVSAGTSASALATIVRNAPAGAVIELANGTYTGTQGWQNANATPANPIYIRGASRDGVILSATSGAVLTIGATSNVIIERMTIRGSQVDAGELVASTGVSFNGGGVQQTRVTIRNTTITGVDRGIINSDGVRELLVYDCTLTGNNTWTQDLFAESQPFPGSPDGIPDVQQHTFWNDDGIGAGGAGNAVFNNTIRGFGDTFTVSVGSDHPTSTGIFFYRNEVPMSGDDLFESDYGFRNMGLYDNRARNAANMVSCDPVYGGPVLVARNILVNMLRVPAKLNGQNTGVFLYNNTFLKTNGLTATGMVAGWYQPASGGSPQRSMGFRNNIFIYRGTLGPLLWLDQTFWDPIDWDHNAYFAANMAINWINNYASLATAQAGMNALTTTPVFSGLTHRMVGDVQTTSNPFNETITLGSNAMTEVTVSVTPTLASGSTPKNSGVAIPNITDGFSGSAPDRGAVITGRSPVVWGDRGATLGTSPATSPAPPTNLTVN